MWWDVPAPPPPKKNFGVKFILKCLWGLCGLPDQSIWRLQRVQNMAARMITGAKMRDHITPILHQLHWLPVHQRIVFKVVSAHIQVTSWNGTILSSTTVTGVQTTTVIKVSKSELTGCAKNVIKILWTEPSAMPPQVLWNNLPLNIRSSHKLSNFKSLLKTYLFTEYFGA